MKIISFLFLILLFNGSTINNIVEKNAVHTDSWIWGYYIMKNPDDGKNYLLLTCQSGKAYKMILYDSNCKKIFEEENLQDYHVFQYGSKVYFIEDDLCELNLSDYKVNRLNIKNDNYKRMEITEYKNNTIVILSNVYGTEVYNLKDSKLMFNIKRELKVKYTSVKYYKGKIIYNFKRNGIAVYSLSENRELWRYDTGEQGVYFLGIKLGSAPDGISDFKGYDDSGEKLVLNTAFGGLYKFDLQTGKILLRKDRFAGKGNNAGMIGSFAFVDMNGDGIKDIVAGSVDHNVYCINGKDFSTMWEYDTGNEIQLPVSLYDINGDKIPEVFCVNDYDNNLFIFDGKTGKPIIEESVKDNNYKSLIQTSVILADFSGNGLLDLIVMRNMKEMQVYEMSSVKVPPDSILYDPSAI